MCLQTQMRDCGRKLVFLVTSRDCSHTFTSASSIALSPTSDFTAERGQARAFLTENELRETHQARENAKRPRNGVNVTNLGTNVFSLQKILRCDISLS